MKLSAPWVKFYNEIKALFEKDPEIKITFDEETPEVKLYVDNERKADALTKLIPSEKAFGNVTLKVTVIPANTEPTKLDLLQEAFYGNPTLSYVWSADTPLGPFNYAVFENKVVQFFNDDMGDINGNCSTLYQELAKDVFGTDIGVHFCTEALDRKVQKPLGEWP